MIIVIRENPDQIQYEALLSMLQDTGLQVNQIQGVNKIILGLVGDTSIVDDESIKALDIVELVKRISEPYRNASRKFHPADTVIELGGRKIGGGNFEIIAGPCSVESQEQVTNIARSVKESGAAFLRGGAFKPRTSPYSFQGTRDLGIEYLVRAKQETGLPIISEVMDISHIELFQDVDVIQVGARNMQNFELLKELGHLNKPILLKRGLSCTLEELLMSAEYIMNGGNEQVILCERGIRTFETATRNTLDLAAVPLLKEKTHLPVIVDPSHGTGIRELVLPMALAATAAGADGLMIEVHNDPSKALCDGAQSLTLEQFRELACKVKAIRPLAFRP